MKNKFWFLSGMVLVGLFVAGCQTPIQPLVVSTTPSLTTMRQSVSTLTPSPSSTLSRSSTPTPTFTSFPTPTLTSFPKDVFEDFNNLSGDCVIKTAYGSISPGKTVQEKLTVDEMMDGIVFSLSGQNANPDLSLSQPDGTPAEVVELNPYHIGASSTPGPEHPFRGPQIGGWTARITGKTAGMYKFAVKIVNSPYKPGSIPVTLHFDKYSYILGDLIKISSRIVLPRQPFQTEYVKGAMVKVIVEDPAEHKYSFTLYDDGQHGDVKKNDGIYANTFPNTRVAGIYKFYFQVSGVDKQSKKPFYRECFRAQTVKPVAEPTPTPLADAEGKVCKGSIKASKPVEVRPANVGGNDSAEFARYAFYPNAVTTDAGVLVTWQMGFDGQRPQPNAYMRMLDNTFKPISDVSILFNRNWVGGTSSLHRTSNGVAMFYCGRFGYRDRTTSAFLDPLGHFFSEKDWFPNDEDSCSTYPVYYGSHLIFVQSRSNYDIVVTTDIDVILTDENGTKLSDKKLHIIGRAIPSLIVDHGIALLAVNIPDTTKILVYRYDFNGTELGEHLVIDPTIYGDNESIVSMYMNSFYLLPTAQGWILAGLTGNNMMYVAHLTPNGASLVSQPVLVNINAEFINGFQSMLPYQGGVVILGELMSGYQVLFLSANGTITNRWIPQDKEELPIYGSLFEHQGRIFIVYTSQPSTKDAKTNQVLIEELQCVP